MKSLKRYFGRSNFPTWPAWVYHPTEDPRLVRNADEAAQLGVCYRDATPDEAMRYNLKKVWDWKDDSLWRQAPYPGTMKFDPKKPGSGKELIHARQDPVGAQHDLVKALIPQVAAAVAAAMQGGAAPSAPAHVSPTDWAEFQAFLAWKKSAEAVTALAAESDADDGSEGSTGTASAAAAASANALNALAQGAAPDGDKALWIEEAKSRGVEIDKRWSVARIVEAIEKAGS